MITATLPQGFVLRAVGIDDLEAVLKIINADEVATDGAADMNADDLRTIWQSPDFNLEQDVRVVLSPEGKIIAVAAVGNRQHVRIFSEVYVHPDYHGRGIGTSLLSLTEQMAQRHIPLAVPDARVTFVASVSSNNKAGQHVIARYGLKPLRHFWRMGIELNEAPPMAQWPEGIMLCPFTPEMAHAVFEADEEAFMDHWGHIRGSFEEWEHWTIKRGEFDPSLWFLAMDGDEIAGFSLCKDEKEFGGWVHVLGVRRPWRRKGIALALLYQSFTEFYRRGIRNVYLGVDAQSLTGATRLYERAGMHVVRQYNNYEKELRAGRELSTQTVDV